MNILWVENHRQFAHIAGKQFLSAYTVTVVPSLAAARLALLREHFDVILLDYDLDDGKGTELAAEITGRNTQSVLIAASAHKEGNQRLIDAGADAVCSKMDFANIDQIIEQLTRQSAP